MNAWSPHLCPSPLASGLCSHGVGSVMDVQHLDLDVAHELLEDGALRILAQVRPRWPPNRVTFKVFTDGITNKLIGCSLDSDATDVVLVRVYGQNTDLLIDRKAETNNFKVLQKAGYAPRLYATFNNGIAYEFVPGEVLSPESVKYPSVYPLVARMMARFHQLECCPPVPKKPVIWDKAKRYLGLIPKVFSSPNLQERFIEYFPEGTDSLLKEVKDLEKKLNITNNIVVFCHNDLLLTNIIRNDGKVTFIDYEYAGYNYQAFDIGNHFAEFAGVTEVDYSRYPDKDFQYSWLNVYLQEFKECRNDKDPVTDSEINDLYIQVNKFALASHLLWATWALVQAHHSTIDFDFMGYATTRVKEYYRKKDLFLSLDTNI